MTACSRIDTARWTEEVQLHDGKMIVVERIARARPAGLLSETRGADIDFEIAYAPLGVHWKGTSPQDAMEVFDGVAYVVTSVGNERIFCKDKPGTALPLKVFKQRGKEWMEIDAATFPTNVALMNLYRSYWGNKPTGDAKGLITWDFKSGRDSYALNEDRRPGAPLQRARTIEEFFHKKNLTCRRFQSSTN